MQHYRPHRPNRQSRLEEGQLEAAGTGRTPSAPILSGLGNGGKLRRRPNDICWSACCSGAVRSKGQEGRCGRPSQNHCRQRQAILPVEEAAKRAETFIPTDAKAPPAAHDGTSFACTSDHFAAWGFRKRRASRFSLISSRTAGFEYCRGADRRGNRTPPRSWKT